MVHRTTLIPDTRMLHSSGEENGERDQLTLGSLRLLCAACMLPLPFSFPSVAQSWGCGLMVVCVVVWLKWIDCSGVVVN
jgi:hypothetical protein